MPRVSNRGTTVTPNTTATPAAGTTGTTATTATTATTPPAGTTTAKPDVVGDPNASGAKVVAQSIKLDGGYTGVRNDYDQYAVGGQNAGNLYNNAGNTAGAKATNKEGYERGAITVASRPVDDKHFAIDVQTQHANGFGGKTLKGNDDGMALYLETKIQGKDKTGRDVEVIARLAMPFKGPANNVDAYNGEHKFLVSYQDLDAALKAHHPDLSLFDKKGAFVGAGATVAVRAKWDNNHNWGGYGRLGVTEIPAPAKKSNAAAVQAGNTGAASSVAISASEMPVDFEHMMPASVQAKFSNIFNKDKPVTVSTRLERELKGKVDSVPAHEAAIVRMQLIAAGYKPLVDELRSGLAAELMDKAKMKPADARAFAKKLSVAPHAEWAQKDDKGAYKDSSRLAKYKTDPKAVVAAGLAKDEAGAKEIMAFIEKAGLVFHDPLPLEDVYKGNKSEMQKSIIRRVRSNAIAEGVYNVKPGPGVLQGDIDADTAKQPCGLIRARIEASVELKDKNVSRDDIAKYEKSDGSAYNVIGQLLEDAGAYVAGNWERYAEAPGTDKTEVSFTMMQERHRFDIEVNGLKLDTSIDFVEVEDPPGSGTKATRQIVEMELEHKFIEATPTGGSTPAAPAAGGAAATPASTQAPALQNRFEDYAAQQKATAEMEDVSLNVPPRFHRLSDLEDKELWHTDEQLVSNAVTNAFVNLIYPGGVSSCEQKGVELARALNKI